MVRVCHVIMTSHFLELLLAAILKKGGGEEGKPGSCPTTVFIVRVVLMRSQIFLAGSDLSWRVFRK